MGALFTSLIRSGKITATWPVKTESEHRCTKPEERAQSRDPGRTQASAGAASATTARSSAKS